MDSVCRTCMRILDVNESAVSINDTDLREKLQVCLPELVLDNVVDPKMCNTCSAALSLSFRFKGMCNEAEKTINSCIQNKTSDGKVKPLNETDLLTIGRRDTSDGESAIVDIEAVDETSFENQSKNDYLESLQILSDVASQATKADTVSTPDIVTCNWDDEIKSTRIERVPRIPRKIIHSHIDAAIDKVVATTTNNIDATIAYVAAGGRTHSDPRKQTNTSGKLKKAPDVKQIPAKTVKTLHANTKKVAFTPKTVTKASRKLQDPPKKVEHAVKTKTQVIPKGVTAKTPTQSPPVESLPSKKPLKQPQGNARTPALSETKIKTEKKTSVQQLKVSEPKKILSKSEISVQKPMRKSATIDIAPKKAINTPTPKTQKNQTSLPSKTLPTIITKELQVKTNKRPRNAENTPDETPKPKQQKTTFKNIVNDTEKSDRTDDVVKALEKLLGTPEYRELLQIQTKTDHNSVKSQVSQKLEQLEKFFNKHKQIQVKSKESSVVKRRRIIVPKPQTVIIKRKRRVKPKTARTIKALEEINLDLAEINDGVERQKQALAAALRKQKPRVTKPAVMQTRVDRKDIKKPPETVKPAPVKSVDTKPPLQSTKSVKQNKSNTTILTKVKNEVITETVNKSKSTPAPIKDNHIKTSPKLTETVKKPKQKIVTASKPENVTSVSFKKGYDVSEVKLPKKHFKPGVRRIRRNNERRQRIKMSYKGTRVDGRSLRRRQPIQSCDQCGRVFKYISHLNVHRRSHVLLKNYKCELCGKSFTLERYLLLHTMLHFSAGEHQCIICEKYFSSWHVLKKHELTHTGERPFVCVMCDRAFTQRVNLETHMRTHTGIKDFICYICNSAFGQKVHLIGHIRTHTGEKPYTCDLCPKAFAKSNVLRDHKALHVLKPYMCDGCNTLFRDDSCLDRHLKKYKDSSQHGTTKVCGKVFNCGICSRCFPTKFSRNRHMKVHVKDLIEGTVA